jgi:hypothetical protein
MALSSSLEGRFRLLIGLTLEVARVANDRLNGGRTAEFGLGHALDLKLHHALAIFGWDDLAVFAECPLES